MANKFRQYDEYSKTDLLWVDRIPRHWKLKKIKRLFKERTEKGYPDEPLLAATQTKGVVPKSMYENRTVTAEKDLHLLKLVEVGDFVISLRSFQGGIEYAYYRGIISPAYTIMVPNEAVNRGYFRYLAKSKLFLELLGFCVTGIREGQNIDYGFLKNSYMPVPPLEEQEQIARYLDYKVSKIRRLISVKKRLIILHQEKIDNMTNRAIQSNAVNSVRLVNIATPIGSQIMREESRKYIPIGLLNRGRGIFHKVPALGSDLGDSQFYQVEANSIVFSGQFAWEGAVALTEEDDEQCIASHRYHMLRGIPDIVRNEYLYAFFATEYGLMLLNVHSRGAAGRNRPLNIRSLLKEYIPLPPMELQDEISREVTLQLRFTKQVKYLESLIEEYSASLISDVITGKVDVRGIEIEDPLHFEEDLDELDEEEIEDLEIDEDGGED